MAAAHGAPVTPAHQTEHLSTLWRMATNCSPLHPKVFTIQPTKAVLGVHVTPAHPVVISAAWPTEEKSCSPIPAKAYTIQPTAEEVGVEGVSKHVLRTRTDCYR